MMEEKRDKKEGNKPIKRNITVHEMDLSECAKYQHMEGSWVIWMLISGIILCFKNLYGGIFLILISVAIFILYKNCSKNASATHYNLALEYIGKNDMNQAKEELYDSIRSNPKNKVSYVLLSSIFYKESNFKKTIENLLNSGVLEVKNSKYNYLIGACYFNMDEYSNSIKHLKLVKYEEQDPMKTIRDILLGRAYYLKGEYKQALKVFNEVKDNNKQINEHLIEFNYFLGMTYLKLNDYDKAKTILLEVYEEDKNYKDIEELISGIK